MHHQCITSQIALTMATLPHCAKGSNYEELSAPDEVSLVGNEDCCPAGQAAPALQSPQQVVRLLRLGLFPYNFTHCVKRTEVIHCQNNEEGMGLIGGQLKYHGLLSE